ncbi:hypothetical protein [Gordonia aurantiaca]|uniref:hypothetical protein n=1 Tax=Gordonia sp. B21 TaxID=3151852 RepID=UPI003267C821
MSGVITAGVAVVMAAAAPSAGAGTEGSLLCSPPAIAAGKAWADAWSATDLAAAGNGSSEPSVPTCGKRPTMTPPTVTVDPAALD